MAENIHEQIHKYGSDFYLWSETIENNFEKGYRDLAGDIVEAFRSLDILSRALESDDTGLWNAWVMFIRHSIERAEENLIRALENLPKAKQ